MLFENSKMDAQIENDARSHQELAERFANFEQQYQVQLEHNRQLRIVNENLQLGYYQTQASTEDQDEVVHRLKTPLETIQEGHEDDPSPHPSKPMDDIAAKLRQSLSDEQGKLRRSLERVPPMETTLPSFGSKQQLTTSTNFADDLPGFQKEVQKATKELLEKKNSTEILQGVERNLLERNEKSTP